MTDSRKNKTPRRRSTAGRPRTKTGGRSGVLTLFVILIALVAAAAGAWHYFYGSGSGLQPVKPPTETTIKVDEADKSGQDADYRKSAAEIRQGIDGFFTKNGGTAATVKAAAEKSVSRSATGGRIRWDVATVAYTPAKTFEPAELAAVFKASPLEVTVGAEGDADYDGSKVPSYAVTLHDKVDNNTVAVTVAHIYVLPVETKDSEKSGTDKAKTGSGSNEAVVPPKSSAKSAAQPRSGARGKARLAIIVDDFGYSYDIVNTFNNMGIPLTYAVIPFKEYSTSIANAGSAAGQDIILHLPMESVSGVTPEPVTITTSMSDGEVRAAVNKAVSAVPHVIGSNNHQGSKATASSRVMKDVMTVFAQDGLFFVDSRTNGASVAEDTARSMGVPTAGNELFIDNDNDVASIESRLRQGANMALDSSSGYAIIIGHARPHTAEALKNMIPVLQAEGIEFVFVKNLVR